MFDSDKHQYDDIINLPHHTSPTRPRMSAIDRAAQFSPFAALTGYDAAVNETARLTEERIELDEYAKADLDAKLQMIHDSFADKPEISITYFVPDGRKAGGAYVTVTGTIKKIDTYEQNLIMTEGQIIPINEIIQIDGELFNGMDIPL